MKERLKKFYRENEDYIKSTALIVVGTTVFVISTHALQKRFDGLAIDTVERRNNEDGSLDIRVTLKNQAWSVWHEESKAS